MSTDPYALTADQAEQLGVTPEQAEKYAAVAREIGPPSAEQCDRLTVLLRPDRRC